jgi:hypothetical protein
MHKFFTSLFRPSAFGTFGFVDLDLFRISFFEIRISPYGNSQAWGFQSPQAAVIIPADVLACPGAVCIAAAVGNDSPASRGAPERTDLETEHVSVCFPG